MAFVSSTFLTRHWPHLTRVTNNTISHQQKQRWTVSKRFQIQCKNYEGGPGDFVVAAGSESMVKLLPTCPRIVLTREEGKNEALLNLLEDAYTYREILEIPCVETVKLRDGIDTVLCYLNDVGDDRKVDWIVLTSPESASIFIDIWKQSSLQIEEVPKLAIIGKSTGDSLNALGFDISFMPSKAIGKQLVHEFPTNDTGREVNVLYPTSKKASSDIQTGLARKKYNVIRIDTYSTEDTTMNDEDLELAKFAHIVTFASPSAVKSWVRNVGVGEQTIVACIGQTSANACKQAGFKRVHYPDAPGLDGWMTAIFEAMKVFEKDISEGEAKEQQRLLDNVNN